MLVLDGDVGTLLLPESARSFAAPAGVTGFFVADLSNPPCQHLALPPGLAVHVCHLPRAAKDTAFQQLRQQALGAGFTHGILAYSHEIFKQQADSQAVEALPPGWEHVDVFQTVSNVCHRRNVDIMVDLRKFNILGPASPAPLPLVPPEYKLAAQAWQGVCVDACAYTMPRAAALEVYLHALARQEEHARAPPLVDGFLRHQVALAALQALLFKEAAGVLQRRAKQGPTGWAEEEGMYWTLALRAVCMDGLKWPLEKCLPELFSYAELGLSLGRMEGVLRLHATLARHKSQALTVHALASLATFPETLYEGCWMGTPAAYTYRLREALATGLSHMAPENEAAAAEQAYAAARQPAARLDSSVQASYKPLAREGDGLPCAKWFPAPDDLLLPEAVHIHTFLDPGRVEDVVRAVLAAGAARCWSWLRILFANAIHSPYCMQWGNHILAVGGGGGRLPPGLCVHLCTATTQPWMFNGGTCAADRGYAFLLALAACLVQAGEDRYQLKPGGLLCLRAGVEWGILSPEAALLVAHLEFPHFS